MKTRFLSILLVSILSVSLLVGCGSDKSEDLESGNTTQEESIDASTETEEENPSTDDLADKATEHTNSSSEKDISIEDKVEKKFVEAMELLYNNDYSDQKKTTEAEEYIKDNFTLEGGKDMLNKILSYNSQVNSSDFLVTLVKEVANTDARYTSMYEIRYNISVAMDKPSIYSDIIATIVVDSANNVFIDKINNFEF